MKPKILCSHCNAILPWAARTCPSCGADVEWPTASGPAPAVQAESKQKKQTKSAAKSDIPWTGIAIGALAIGVFLYAILNENRPAPAPVAPTAQMPPASGPNMGMAQQIQALEAEVRANPSNAEKLLELANVQHDARFFENAIGSYRAYLKIKPNNPDARVDMGICLHELGRDDEAIQEMKRALKDDPKHLQAHFNIGIVTLTQGNMAVANEWFRKTVALAPNSEMGQRAQQMLSQHNPQQLQQPQ